MRLTTERRVALRLAALVAVFLAFGYALVQFAGAGRPRTDALPAPPPGADDPSNRGVLVPGGTFLRGSDDEGADNPASPYSTADERPRRRVTVASFWIQEHEVTNEEYRRFDSRHEFPAGQERHPVVGVTWEEAMAYANWIGGSLPTEAQWEFAARGTASRRFPWGDSAPTCERAHYRDCEPPATIEVMTRPDGATPEGVHDLAGNVWEWVKPDWLDPPRTPINDAARRLRGGSYLDDPFFLRGANRSNDFFRGFRHQAAGFRVVWPVHGRGN